MIERENPMNDQFIQGVIFDWNKIDDDSYLKQIEALKDVERLEFQNSINFLLEKMEVESLHY